MNAKLAAGGRAILLTALVAVSLAPLYWMAVASLKPGGAPIAAGNQWWPDQATLSNFVQLFGEPLFARWVLNTVVVTGATVMIGLIASVLAGYALAYLDVPYSRNVVLVFFASYLLPQSVLFIPLLRLLGQLHLLNSPAALVLAYPSMVIPFGTWVAWSFFRRLPRDLVDSARADGAGPLATIVQVLLPVAWPALATVGLYAVAMVFNDYLYTTTFIQETSGQTIMGALGALVSADINNPGESFAAAILASAPLALVCAFFADMFARGLGTGIIET